LKLLIHKSVAKVINLIQASPQVSREGLGYGKKLRDDQWALIAHCHHCTGSEANPELRSGIQRMALLRAYGIPGQKWAEPEEPEDQSISVLSLRF
jgi:hypothetical protein